MCDFLAEYQCSPTPDPEYEKAYFLTLRYAVRTEQYDRTLPHVLSRGEALVRFDYRGFSNANARKEIACLHTLLDAAGVSKETDHQARTHVARLSYEAQQEQLLHMPAELRQLIADLKMEP